MPLEEKMKHRAKRKERKGCQGESESKKAKGDMGRQAQRREQRKGKVRASSMMKREACFGKKVPLPGNREGHGVSKAMACRGMVCSLSQTHIWPNCEGLMKPCPLTSWLPLLVTRPPVTCSQITPTPVPLSGRTPPAVESVPSPLPHASTKQKNPLSLQINHAYLQEYRKLTDC